MRRGFAIAAVAFACGGKRPPPVVNVQQQPSKGTITYEPYAYRVAAPRPAIDVDDFVPDFHEELRWPLSHTEHPALAPRFGVAQELAIGIDWEELCKRGVQQRVSATQKELLSYLRGWCYVAKRDVDNACAQLTPLISSTKSGLRPAVRQDLANILVQEGADRAEHWLNKHNIRDLHILDLLAANFVEVGSETDALVLVRRATDADDYATAATKCRRLVKRIVLARGSGDASFAYEELKEHATVPKIPDELCRTAYNKINCWLHRNTLGCADYFKDENLDPRIMSLHEAYKLWPSAEADSYDWWWVATRAEDALPLAGAAELIVTAWEATLRANPSCSGVALDLHEAIDMLRGDPSNAAFEARVAKLAKDCPKPSLSAEAPVQTASASPSALPGCDAVALRQQGIESAQKHEYDVALVHYEKSLACRDDPHTVRHAFVAACNGKNSGMATRYYRRLSLSERQRLAQECIQNRVRYE